MDRRLIKQIAETIRQADRHKTHAYDTAATVVRVEGGTAWVHIPGGVDETPVKLTVDAKQGDTVQVRVSGGRAFLVGNATAPPTDDTKANKVGANLTATQKVVKAVKATAEKASRIATSTAQYFWVSTGGTDNGAHITAIPQEEFEADPQNGGGNTLMTSNGVAVRDGLTELATFSANGTRIGTDTGTAIEQTDTAINFLENDVVVGSVETTSGMKLKNNATGENVAIDNGIRLANQSNYFEVFDSNGGLNINGNPMIVKDTFSDLNKSASTYYYQKSFTVTKSGYTPIAFNPYTNHATEAACMVNYNSSTGIATVTVMSRNSTISGLNLYLDVTYARNEFL